MQFEGNPELTAEELQFMNEQMGDLDGGDQGGFYDSNDLENEGDNNGGMSAEMEAAFEEFVMAQENEKNNRKNNGQ